MASQAMNIIKASQDILDPFAGSGRNPFQTQQPPRLPDEFDPLRRSPRARHGRPLPGHLRAKPDSNDRPVSDDPGRHYDGSPGHPSTEGGGEPWTTSFTNSHRGSSNPASRTAGRRVASSIAWQVRTGRCWARSMPSDTARSQEGQKPTASLGTQRPAVVLARACPGLG